MSARGHRGFAALVVAGSMEQADLWMREMGLGRGEDTATFAARVGFPYTPSQVRRESDFPWVDEAFFVGTWDRLPAEVLWRLAVDLEHVGVPATYVCAPDGEIVGRKAMWFRWSAPSTGAPTRLHVLRRADDVAGMGPDETLVSECGLTVTRQLRMESPVWEQWERWGVPAGGCGVCAHALWKQPPGDFNSRRAALAVAAHHLGMLRVEQAAEDGFKEAGRAAKVAEGKIAELRRVFARDMRDLAG